MIERGERQHLWPAVRCLLVAGTCVFGPLLLALDALATLGSGLKVQGGGPLLLALLVCAGVMGGLLMGMMQLFLRLWFGYLKALPVTERARAEAQLAQLLDLSLLEPSYSHKRRTYLGEPDRQPEC